MTAKQAARRIWWKQRLQVLRLWCWCGAGVGITLLLPGLRSGIKGIKLYRASPLEIGVGLGVAFIAVMLDEELGDKVVTKPQVWNRKRKHAFITGIGALAIIEKLLG